MIFSEKKVAFGIYEYFFICTHLFAVDIRAKCRIKDVLASSSVSLHEEAFSCSRKEWVVVA